MIRILSLDDDIWVELPQNSGDQCYKRAVIKSILNQNVEVRYQDGKEGEVKAALVFPTNSYKNLSDGFEDMVEMENLSEAELLYNLKERYEKWKIFTYVGPTLIVLNPYKMIPELFTKEVLEGFQNAVRELKFEHKNFQPHVYAISAGTMTNLIRDQKNQAIVIAGESGAGKTENTKFAMKFLTSMNNAGGKTNADEISIEDKVQAHTVLCDNNHRF